MTFGETFVLLEILFNTLRNIQQIQLQTKYNCRYYILSCARCTNLTIYMAVAVCQGAWK